MIGLEVGNRVVVLNGRYGVAAPELWGYTEAFELP
jgi:hypothetical protein